MASFYNDPFATALGYDYADFTNYLGEFGDGSSPEDFHQTSLRQATHERDTARLQLSTARNELYAARQNEKGFAQSAMRQGQGEESGESPPMGMDQS
ncbi:hypothetical protein N0V88_008100 [Collariella sp. IMI 366227]|nr:hypothetical protein N0V88_008100 [Collariella sp. IMI 366227]